MYHIDPELTEDEAIFAIEEIRNAEPESEPIDTAPSLSLIHIFMIIQIAGIFFLKFRPNLVYVNFSSVERKHFSIKVIKDSIGL